MIHCSETQDQNLWGTLPHNSWQHTWEFGEVQKQNGRNVGRFIIKDHETIVGYAQTVAYDLFASKTIAYCPYGPVWISQPEPEHWNVLRAALVSFGQDNNSIAVRVESAARSVIAGFAPSPASLSHASFHVPRGEMKLSIDGSFESIQAGFHKKTAYNIRKATRKGIYTKIYSGADMMSQLDLFIELNKANMRGHGSTTHADTYFNNLFTVLSGNARNFVIVAYSQDAEPQAINIFTLWGSQCYCPFGASTAAGKKSAAYYMIKHDAIVHLRSLGVETFNWGGISVGRNDTSLQGLNQFKLGFGGDQIIHGYFYDLVLSPWYWVYALRSWIKSKTSS